MNPHPLEAAAWPVWPLPAAPPAVPGSRPPRGTAAGTGQLATIPGPAIPPAAESRHDRLARLVARAAGSFEHGLLGRAPTSVTVVGTGSWMVVHLHEQFSPLERRLSRRDEAGAERVRAFHQGLFERTVAALLDHVRGLTGVPLCGGIAHVDVATGSVLKTLATSPGLDLFVMGRGLPVLGVPVDDHRRVRLPAPGEPERCRT